VGLEWGPLCLVSTTGKLPRRKSSSSGLENENKAIGICHADHMAPSIKLAHASPTSGSRSVGIVCSRIQAMEFNRNSRCIRVIECAIKLQNTASQGKSGK
jgi:hypothetical protein